MKSNPPTQRQSRRITFWQRKYLIAKKDQLTVVMFLVLNMTVIMGISFIVLYHLMNRALKSIMYSIHIKIDSIGDVLIPIVVEVNIAFLIAVIISSWLLLHIMNIRLKNALLSFHRNLDKVGDIDFLALEKIKHSDATEEMVEAFNDMAGLINEKMYLISNTTSELGEILKDKEFDTSKVKQKIHTIRTTIKYFTHVT